MTEAQLIVLLLITAGYALFDIFNKRRVPFWYVAISIMFGMALGSLTLPPVALSILVFFLAFPFAAYGAIGWADVFLFAIAPLLLQPGALLVAAILMVSFALMFIMADNLLHDDLDLRTYNIPLTPFALAGLLLVAITLLPGV